ncbi:hypothetical protein E2C01_002025 [Portunus trituberculatus]|uniref:Uncharacterized protein n=1 Tax=Portunus trituberculatus TaxID=210409 RepID=A0A5B7CL12_PORTR|nr:hypothetical protein [Portunus trituberculatus]
MATHFQAAFLSCSSSSSEDTDRASPLPAPRLMGFSLRFADWSRLFYSSRYTLMTQGLLAFN